MTGCNIRNGGNVKFATHFPNEIDLRREIKLITESNRDWVAHLFKHGVIVEAQVNAMFQPVDFDDKNIVNLFDKIIQLNQLCAEVGGGEQIYYILRCDDGHIFDLTN